MSIVQKLAAHLLDDVRNGQNLSETITQLYTETPELSPSERAALRDLSYGSLRFYGRLRALLDRLVKKPLTDFYIDSLLIVALYQLEYTKAPDYAIVDGAVKVASSHARGQLKALVNGVLRTFLREKTKLEHAIRHDEQAKWNHSAWWIQEIKKRYPKHWQQILTAGNEHPPMCLRVNLKKNSVSDYLKKLNTAGIAAHRLDEDKHSPIILKQPVPVEKLPEFTSGSCSVQDAGAQAAAHLLSLAPHLRVLDACAAPGGKSAHMLELAAIELLSLDIDAKRLAKVETNFERLGVRAQTQRADAAKPEKWWDGRSFDRILADVPCSASGVVRRQPDVKWTRKSSDIAKFAAQQRQILDALWPTLKVGGKLLYATCSIFSEENEEQIDTFLIRHADAQLILSDQYLPNHEHDGFYYALLEKVS